MPTMNIRLAGQGFLNTPSLGRTLVIGGGAGAAATALAHLINAPEEQQVAIVQEADDRGLTPTELIIGAFAAGVVGEGTHILGDQEDAALDDAIDKLRRDELILQENERTRKKLWNPPAPRLHLSTSTKLCSRELSCWPSCQARVWPDILGVGSQACID